MEIRVDHSSSKATESLRKVIAFNSRIIAVKQLKARISPLVNSLVLAFFQEADLRDFPLVPLVTYLCVAF